PPRLPTLFPYTPLFRSSAERLPQFQALWPKLKTVPVIAPPQTHQKRSWSRDEALVEILRGRLEGLGPVDATALARPLGLITAERSEEHTSELQSLAYLV